MTYQDPMYMERVAPNCHNQVPILSAIGRGPVGPQGPRGVPGPLSRKDFDTVADMIADESLVKDDICHTLGFHVAGDGGAAWYKVESDGTANGMDILQLDNGGVAELQVTESYVTPEMFGAWGDGVHDDSVYLNAAINYAITEGVIIKITNGEYIADVTLSLDNESILHIEGENGVIIPKIIGITVNYNGAWDISDEDSRKNIIRGLEFKFNADNSTAIKFMGTSFSYSQFPIIIDNCVFRNKNNDGCIGIELSQLNGCYVSNCSFVGNGVMTGIKITSGINYFISNCNFYNCFTAIHLVQDSVALEGVCLTNSLVMYGSHVVYHEQTGSRLLIGCRFNNNMLDQLKLAAFVLQANTNCEICNNYIGASASNSNFKALQISGTFDVSFLRFSENNVAANQSTSLFVINVANLNYAQIEGNSIYGGVLTFDVTGTFTKNTIANNVFFRTATGNSLSNNDFAIWNGNVNVGNAFNISNGDNNVDIYKLMSDRKAIALDATYLHTNNTPNMQYVWVKTKADTQQINVYYGSQTNGKQVLPLVHNGETSFILPLPSGETININSSEISKLQMAYLYND